VESHVEFLRRASLDEDLAAALRRDYTQAELPVQDRAMLDFAVQLTRAAWKLTPEHLTRLREVGFDDVGILQITLIASWFNYINRVADALGVGKGDALHPSEGKLP
jgi:uncharacterized peroxidase-related enzyme